MTLPSDSDRELVTPDSQVLSEAELWALQSDPAAALQQFLKSASADPAETEGIIRLATELWTAINDRDAANA